MNAPREKSQGETGGAQPSSQARRGGTELITEEGRTTINDTVVTKVAGVAAREVAGVYAMGGGMSRALGAMRDQLSGGGGSRVTQGVTVEVGERQAAIDLDLTVEYGVSIPELAAGVRRNVSNAVEKICGLEVTEVNVAVNDVHLPGEDQEEQQESESRVR
jgi:uncharacterized alkaline shock family protein YloU